MRLIPGKTKVGVELFKGVTLTDIIIYAIGAAFLLFVVTSSLPGKVYMAFGVVIVTVVLGVRMDNEPTYLFLLHILRHYASKRKYARLYTDQVLRDMRSDEATDIAIREMFGKKKDRKKSSKNTEEDSDEPLLSKAEQKKKAKEKEALRKKEDKILKDKKAPLEEKDAIRQKRKEEYAKQAADLAKRKDEQTDRYPMDDIVAFTDIHDDFIDYDGKYFGAAIEIDPVEFRFFSEYRRANSVENGIGRILRALRSDYGANIVKIERPINYDEYLKNEYTKVHELKRSFENGTITEAELQSRVEVLYDRINDLEDLCYEQKVVAPYYYLVLFHSDRQQLNIQVKTALDDLQGAELPSRRLDTKGLAVFLKYTNQIDFDEREVEEVPPQQYAQWAMPEVVDITPRTVQVNHIITHNMLISDFPTLVDDAWMAGVMSIPATKVVIKCTPMDRTKVLRSIDRSLQELRGQYTATGVDSKRMELANHIDTLATLLAMLQGDNEALVCTNVYVTAYDINRTRESYDMVQPPQSARASISEMKKTVRRIYQEASIRLNGMDFNQMEAFIGSQISGYDPLRKLGRGIPTNSVSSMYPWVYAHVSDKKGTKFGSSDGVPVFIDFFRRDSERVNSNMVIVGKSGSGKSYATKSILTNLAADDSKIFILDPENEYTELAKNLHGKFINVGNAQYGRLNPFHIITALDDDESDSGGDSSATHLQFLEEFFRQILPDCEKDALEYLNSMVDRMYSNKGITEETDLSHLRPEDYPIFDDLYDTILEEFQATDNEYIRTMLRTLMNYVSKFSAGGRNAILWDGPSTVTTEENFTVFNFQSLLANRNGSVANAQMLLVLKYIDNEIIKNRDFNIKYHANRKIVVVIDEAHVFIDTKYPVALDFMFQLAKRIRKYNGMQIVITQNIKDFVGSEEIARKSTAIINACQHSFIFALAPNDMDDLCLLYEKAGGINENEQEQIVSAPRGQAFTIMSPQSRSSFKVEVPEGVKDMFENPQYASHYFLDEEGKANWEELVGESRQLRAEVMQEEEESLDVEQQLQQSSRVTFQEITEEEYEAAQQEAPRKRNLSWTEIEELEETADISEIPEDPAEFAKLRAAQAAAVAAEAQAAMQAVPQVVVQAPAATPEMGQMVENLSRAVENLSRFSYDSIMDQVRATMAASPAAAPAQPVQPAEEEDFSLGELFGSTEAADESTSLGSIFNADALAEAARLDAEESELFFQQSAEGTASEEDEDSALIDALFGDTEESDSGITAIDMMRAYGDTVVGITLEDLAKYIVSHKDSL